MCLGNFEPIELPTFEYSMPDEDFKGSCDYLEIDDLDSLSPNISDLRLIHLNIRGLVGKQNELNNLLINGYGTAKPVDIAMINETWLRNDTLNKVSFPGYNLLSKQRIGKKGGGICMIIADKFKHRQRDDLLIKTSCFEHLIIKLKTRTAPMILVSVYRPPNTNAKEFLRDYKNLISSLNKHIGTKTPIVIGTDHNLDFLKCDLHQVTQDFVEYNLESKLIPVITRPTRITKSSATLIDNIFISQNLVDDYWCGLLLNDISDHLPCLLTIEKSDPDMKGYNLISTRSMTDTKLTNIKHDLDSINWGDVLLGDDCQTAYDKFKNTLTNILDSHAPVLIKQQKTQPKTEPWITPGLKQSRQKQKKLYKEFIKSQTDHTETKYKCYRNILKRTIRKARIDYYNNKCTEVKGNMKNLCFIINQAIGKQTDKSTAIKTLQIDNIVVSGPKVIANELAKYFASVGKNYAEQIPAAEKSIDHYLDKIPANPKGIFVEPTTRVEILMFLNQLSNKKVVDQMG